ncbi:MAG TPA: hypothetical protein DCY47_14205 [Candidatus Accumulibacter sp.]|nr:hypothetical protein [Accumulibacter sp.]
MRVGKRRVEVAQYFGGSTQQANVTLRTDSYPGLLILSAHVKGHRKTLRERHRAISTALRA